ncbi:MAG: nucleotidyltransferase [Sphingobacteriales bacterium 41-5]|nr:MAG: nucleotidyltransferase [Sphingobacteriales bacterium 41-5]
MEQRFASIFFPFLLADYTVRQYAHLKNKAFVLAEPERGRSVVKAVNSGAAAQGISAGMVVADCKAILPDLQVLHYKKGLAEKLLHNLGMWCIRFSPVVAVDLPDGLIIETTGCSHLWGGEENYLKTIIQRLKDFGYEVKGAIAPSIGGAFAVARFGEPSIIKKENIVAALSDLPPAALRLQPEELERLDQLGIHHIQSLLKIPRSALQRRFGATLLKRTDQALGNETEFINPLIPPEPYTARLPALEPICTAAGIEIALQELLKQLCNRLQKEGLGLRRCRFITYRIDAREQQLMIGTTQASCNQKHLFKLFEEKISTLEPGLGIELFVLEAPEVEKTSTIQETLWNHGENKTNTEIAELVDRIAGRVSIQNIHRFLPAEHYWPEFSFVDTSDLKQKPQTEWRTNFPRPLHLLPKPELIQVTAPVPDYPPMLFRYKSRLHKIINAEGPERIEQEWWLQQGLYRDYYCVEDEEGKRFWLFRSGDYGDKKTQWFVHGFFA